MPVFTENLCADNREDLPTYLDKPSHDNVAISKSNMASTTREELIESLKGQKIRIYGLDKFLSGWPSVVNPNLEALRQDMEARVTRCAASDHSNIGSMALLMKDI